MKLPKSRKGPKKPPGLPKINPLNPPSPGNPPGLPRVNPMNPPGSNIPPAQQPQPMTVS